MSLPSIAAISAVLYRHDHMGIADGAPADEYEPEARDLAGRLPTLDSVAQLQDALHEVFGYWFGPEIAPPRDAFASTAREILTLDA